MLFGEGLERHRRTAADLLDGVVRTREEPVLVVDCDPVEMLEEEVSPSSLLRRRLGLSG
jgi:hypothetical protein